MRPTEKSWESGALNFGLLAGKTLLLEPSSCKEYVLDAAYSTPALPRTHGVLDSKTKSRPLLVVFSGITPPTWLSPTKNYIWAWEDRLGFPRSLFGQRPQCSSQYIAAPHREWWQCPILTSAYLLFLRSGVAWRTTDTLETFVARMGSYSMCRDSYIYQRAAPRLQRLLAGDSAFNQTWETHVGKGYQKWPGIARSIHGQGIADGLEDA